MGSTLQRRGFARSAVLLAAIAATTFTACGSDDGGSTDTGTTASSGGASNPVVEQARKLSDEGKKDLIYFPSDEYIPPDELKAMTEWLGPDEAPAVKPGQKVVFVSCGAQPCNESVDTGLEIAKQLGWDATAINKGGKSGIADLNRAMASALALKPDAIVGVAIPAVAVADQLQKANDAGIVTVSVSDPTPTGPSNRYAAAADYPNSAVAQMLAYTMIADFDGEVNVVAIEDAAFPSIVNATRDLGKVIETCEGCSFKTAEWQITDAADPTKAAGIVNSIINANPDLDVIATPYSTGIQAVVQAVRSSGKDIKIYAKGMDATSFPALAKGDIAIGTSADQALSAYQAVDQVIRGLAEAPYVEKDKLPLLTHVWTKDTVPPGNVPDFNHIFPYKEIYEKMWGLSG